MAEFQKNSDESNALWKIVASGFSANFPIMENKVNRFLRKINQFFKRAPNVDSKLTGRIHELQATADQILDELLAIKRNLKEEVEPALFDLVEAIIDPLIKEIHRIRQIMEKEEKPTRQVKTFKRFTTWIDKARMWIDLCMKHKENGVICQAIVEYTCNEFHSIIDRDLQVIQDYLIHSLDNLHIDDSRKNECQMILENVLTPDIMGLQQLKQKSDNLSLDVLNDWRLTANRSREKHFSNALHAIDTFIHDLTPQSRVEDESHHSVEILVRLTSIESKIANLASELSQSDMSNGVQKKRIKSQLALIEKETHQLNSDLRLNHDHIERLQKSLQLVAWLQQQLYDMQ
jgi:hypothetical protein